MATKSVGAKKAASTSAKEVVRTAEFSSALAEVDKQPIAFMLDGVEWDCHAVVMQRAINVYKAVDGTVNDFVLACVKDPIAWQARIDEEDGVPYETVSLIFNWLLKQYFGADSGK